MRLLSTITSIIFGLPVIDDDENIYILSLCLKPRDALAPQRSQTFAGR